MNNQAKKNIQKRYSLTTMRKSNLPFLSRTDKFLKFSKQEILERSQSVRIVKMTNKYYDHIQFNSCQCLFSNYQKQSSSVPRKQSASENHQEILQLKYRNSVSIQEFLKKENIPLDVAKKDEDFNKIVINILRKPLGQRNLNDIQFLKNYTQKIKFFEALIEQDQSLLVDKCLYNLEYAHYKKGSFVCKQGDKGDNFYLILQGEVAILIKIWDELFQKNVQTEVNKLGSGYGFGEQALLHDDNRRTATIYCKTGCHFAVLKKIAYQKLLLDYQNKQLNEKIYRIHKLDMFKMFQRNVIQTLIYHFEEIKFNYGNVLYCEGDESDSFYITLKGSFQINKKIQYHQQNTQFIQKHKMKDTIHNVNKKTDGFKTIGIEQVGEEQFIGDYEALTNIRRLYSVTCIKDNSLVYKAKIKDVLKRIKDQSEYEYMLNLTKSKQQWRNQRYEFLVKQFQQELGSILIQKQKLEVFQSEVIIIKNTKYN